MNDQERIEFEQWLPQGVQMLSDKLPEEFVDVVSQAKSVEEIDNILNNWSQSEDGAQLINALYQAYKQISSQQNVVGSMKAGGKLDYFVNCFGRGGKTDKCGCGCKAIKAKGGEVFPAPKTTYRDKKTGEELSLEEAYSRPEDIHLVETTPDVLSRLNDISNKAKMLWNLRKLPTNGRIRRESIIAANPEGSGKVSLPVKQGGGEIHEPIPRMTYEKTGDVEQTRDLGSGHSFGLILGEAGIVDGNTPVFIPNKAISAGMAFANAGRGQVLLPDYGYADEGQTVFTPNEIEARKKTRLVDKAHVQHPTGLAGYQNGGRVEKAQKGKEMPAVYSLFDVIGSKEYKKGLPVSGIRQNRGGGGDITDYGELVTDENGLQYRDTRRTDWNSFNGELNQDFYRDYVPNRAYKKMVKRGWKQPLGYTQEQLDSLKTTFNGNFGDLGKIVQNDKGHDYWQVDADVINRYYPWFNRK